MNKPTLLILAASRYQIPFIQCAKNMGYRVVTSDNVSDNPGHALADVAYNVDTVDFQGILEISRKEHIAGILSPSTDIAMPTVSYVGETLGLRAPSSRATRIACDKTKFRAWQKEERLPFPAFTYVSTPTEVPALLKEGWCVLKPDRSSGSKGIFIVRSEEEYFLRLPETLSFCRGGHAVLERYLEGRQLTCEGILQNGRLVSFWIMDRRTAHPPYVATVGHRLPSGLSHAAESNIANVLENTWNRLGVTDGPFDSDLVLVGDTPYILEMSPRVGGNSITSLLKASSEADLIAYAITWAVGDESPVLDSTRKRPAELLLLGATQPGILQYNQQAVECLKCQPGIEHIALDLPCGSRVATFSDGRKRVGEILITADTAEQLDEQIAMAKMSLNLHIGEPT